MLSAFIEILRDNWQWRKQIGNLALFELIKKSRGAVLSWAWLIVKPTIFIFCFWFAIEIGLRSGSSQANGTPYLLWLSSGIIPWFFMSEMMGGGVDVFRRYRYLVNKIKFPLSAISSVFSCASMLVQLMLMVVLFIMFFLFRQTPTIYLLQVPILLAMMLIFWTFVSILFSPLSALSKDIANLLHALTQPIFWLSGVIFNVDHIQIEWIKFLLNINPVTFFASSFRDAFCGKEWFWSDTIPFLSFLVVFFIIVFLATLTYKNLNKEVADVL